MLDKAQASRSPINVPEFESSNNKTKFENYLAQDNLRKRTKSYS